MAAINSWRWRVKRSPDAAALDYRWYEQLARHRHQPYPGRWARSRNATLRVTLHTGGLAHALPEEERSLQVLLSFVPKPIDAVCTPGTASQGCLALLSRLDWIRYGERFDSVVGGDRIKVRLRGTYTSMPLADVDGFLVRHTLPDSATDQDLEAVRAAWSDMEAHKVLDRDVFLTAQPSLLRHRQSVGAKLKIWILTVDEVVDYFETVEKGEGHFFFSSHVTTDRWTYYDERTSQLVPTLGRLWSAVSRWDQGVRDIVLEYVVSLHTRLRYLTEARDRIGYLYYTSAELDANDAVLYHLNYFFLLTTAVFDNLAWILNHLYHLNLDKREVDLRRSEFRGRIGKDFAEVIAYRQSLLDVFYDTRHSVAHRLAMWGIGFRDRQTGGGSNLVEISDDLATAVEAVDSVGSTLSGQPYTQWGLARVGPAALLEPYRFTTSALREILTLVEEFLALVLADETIGWEVPGESSGSRDALSEFTIPLFRPIV